MILSKFVEIKTKGLNNKESYKLLGYNLEQETFRIKIEDLSIFSRAIISAKCVFCKKIIDIQYVKYIKSSINGGFCCSGKCSTIKRKNTNLERYGVEYAVQSDIIIEKTKKTNLERYGVENAIQSKEVRNKIKKTILDRYGVDNIFQNEEIKDKIKETNLQKYGVEYVIKSNENKELRKKLNLQKYGVEYTLQLKDIRDKIKKTNLIKYGFEYATSSEIIKNKIKNSNLIKYGLEHFLQLDSVKLKIRETNLEKYGFEVASKSKIIKEKTLKTFITKYGGIGYSSSIIANKIKETNLEKYGVKNSSQTKEAKDKKNKTNLDKYGVLEIQKNENYRKENYKLAQHNNYIKYINNGISLFMCDFNEDHNFEINKDNYYNRITSNLPLCTICYPIGEQKSIKELELLNFINEIYKGEVISGYRDNLEIDIYLPDIKIGFEFNGLYWHSEKFKDRRYHLNKTLYFKEKGIRIIHIFEDDWTLKREIILSQVKNLLKLTENKIFARKCIIKEIIDNSYINFLESNHIQGYVSSVIKLGLYYNNELVSLMTFDNFEGRKRMEEGGWNLSRFCNKLNHNIIGSASKLLSFFMKKYNPFRIVSYADRSCSEGNLYNILGFELISESNPDYKYVINNKRIHKSNFKKSKLVENGSSLLLSEKQIMLNFRYERIYDCGKIKYEIKK